VKHLVFPPANSTKSTSNARFASKSQRCERPIYQFVTDPSLRFRCGGFGSDRRVTPLQLAYE
jgi:hypothetical protein